MNSAVAIFFASLVSGVMSLAELRPTAADLVQILTGLELTPQENQIKGKKQQANCAPASKKDSAGKDSAGCRTALFSQASGDCRLPQPAFESIRG